MMPMLESLANTVSALPTAASASPSFSGASGSGGFAAALAAAQEQSATPQSGSGNGQGSDSPDSNGSASGGTTNATLGFANNFNARGAASGTAQLRKSTGNSASNNSLAVALAGAVVVTSPLPQPIAMTAVPLTPAIVPAISTTTTGIPVATTTGASPQPNVSLPNLLQANGLPASFSQTSVQQSISEQSDALQSGVLQSGLPQPSFPASPATASAAAQTPTVTGGSIQPALAASGFGATTAGTVVPSASDLNPSPGSASLSSTIPSLSASGIFNATGISAESDGQEASGKTATATVNVTAPAITSNPEPVSPNTTASWNGPQNNWGAVEPVVLAENTLPFQFSSAFGEPTSSAPSAPNQTVNVTTPSSNLLATVFPEAVSQQSLPSSADAGQPSESNVSSDGMQGNVTSSFPISENTAAPVADVSTPSAQTPSAAVLNLAAQILASKAPLPVAAPQLTTAPNNTPVRAAAGRQSAPASTSTAAAESNSATTLPVASQTPFSVFFSNAGPGTESAALALPKLVTPVTASAMHLTNPSLVNSSLTNSSAAGAQGTNVAQASSQSTASQNASAKGALSGTSSGNSPAGQALHRETDASVTGLAVAASQPATIGAPAPPAASGISASPVALAADSAAKPEALPAPVPASPVITAPAPPPTPPTAIPGPVQVAQMVSRVGQSEMRIGMNTSAFGTVDVRTVVHASDVGLVIGSEKGDLRGLMTNEMPGISNSLQQQNLRLNSVSFMQGFASSGNGNGSGSADSQQRFFPQHGSSNSLLPETVDDSVDTTGASEYGSSRGLSILA